MIVTCSKCLTRLQLDNAKVPSRPFSVRCPKCDQIVNVQPPVPESEGDVVAFASDSSPLASMRQEPRDNPMSTLESGNGEVVAVAQAQQSAAGDGDMARLLSALLRRSEEKSDPRGVMRRPSWEPRRALICIGSFHCNMVARALAENGYEVSVAEGIPQAFERMREERLEVIVLDTEFQVEGQGPALISREINTMRMAERRRVVFVHLSTTLRSGDAHAAFLSNVNLIVNTADVRQLPQMLEKNIRDLNELYRDLNRALNMAEL